jgi:hypothetical protein
MQSCTYFIIVGHLKYVKYWSLESGLWTMKVQVKHESKDLFLRNGITLPP